MEAIRMVRRMIHNTKIYSARLDQERLLIVLLILHVLVKVNDARLVE